jgi:hypothetical protein
MLTSLEGRPLDEWHRLEEYLKGTEGTVPDLRTERSRVVESGLSPAKTTEFGCGEWGYLAGLWHDMGKFQKTFRK